MLDGEKVVIFLLKTIKLFNYISKLRDSSLLINSYNIIADNTVACITEIVLLRNRSIRIISNNPELAELYE